jgi:hypothetical protein
VPFKRGWRAPWDLKRPGPDQCSERIDFDTGLRTEVDLEVEHDPDFPEDRTITLKCGHATIEETIRYHGPHEHSTAISDVKAVQITLAHHAYMSACDCIRPLWRLFFEMPLCSFSAETPLWAGKWLAEDDDHHLVTRFFFPKGPPAPRWVVKPEVTWDESEKDWPQEDS